MAKTLLTLIAEAARLADEQGVANAVWVDWLNSGVDDLSPALYIDARTTIAKNAAGVFPAPADYIATIRIDGVNKSLPCLADYDDVSTGYKFVAGNFELQNDAATTITLLYYKSLPYFSTTTADTPMATSLEQCGRALVFYACAMCMLEEDETERYQNYMDEYNKAKAAIAARAKSRGPARVGIWGVTR